MTEYCVLCGTELVDGQCPKCNEHFKPMCLNCSSCSKHNEGDCYVCNNQELLTEALEQATKALPAGYEFSSVSLKPRCLKVPTKKCSHWSANMGTIAFEVKKLFTKE